MAGEVRSIRFEKKKKVGKRHLWRIIGLDVALGKVIAEDPVTGVRRAFYGTTWVECNPGGVVVKDWGRDALGNQIEVVTEEYEYVDPSPPRPAHRELCACVRWQQKERRRRLMADPYENPKFDAAKKSASKALAEFVLACEELGIDPVDEVNLLIEEGFVDDDDTDNIAT